MQKSAQSLLDLFNLLSGERTFLIFKSPVTNKEAQSLYKMWSSGSKDEYGRIDVPPEIDPFVIQSLAEKKLVRNVDMRLANKRTPLIEITDEGQKIIRDIILYAEKSSYDGGIENVDYEEIYKTIKFGPGVKKAKVAFKLITDQRNWLQKANKP